jgi:hypothetical protein
MTENNEQTPIRGNCGKIPEHRRVPVNGKPQLALEATSPPLRRIHRNSLHDRRFGEIPTELRRKAHQLLDDAASYDGSQAD